MDEMGKNLVKDKYPPEPAKPGQVAREDYTKRRKKAVRTCSLCMNRSRANAIGIGHRTSHQEGLGALYARDARRALS
jgi:hypothetical protein